jgi:hypothetical protein
VEATRLVPSGLPPKAKAAVCVPAPTSDYLAVFKPVGLEVQLVPSYNSVAPVAEVVLPPKPKPMFVYHNLLNFSLAVFKGLDEVSNLFRHILLFVLDYHQS